MIVKRFTIYNHTLLHIQEIDPCYFHHNSRPSALIYTLSIKASAIDNPSISHSEKVTFRTSPDSLVPILEIESGGRTMVTTDMLALSGSRSYDESDNDWLKSYATLSFEWECFQTSTTESTSRLCTQAIRFASQSFD